VFTLCGGHISTILVGAERAGLAVIGCRDERSAVFAADAAARMTGLPGVAAVTAGPGVTNALTAVKNAQLAQTPLVLFGGATATVLTGRGALQDIDQLSLVRSAVKWAARCTTVAALAPMLEQALDQATGGVPGPVFLEVPVDVLYPEETVRQWYLAESGVSGAGSLQATALGLYLKAHLLRQFHAPHLDLAGRLAARTRLERQANGTGGEQVAEAVRLLDGARRPVLVVGNQTMVGERDAASLAAAVEALGVPVWLGGAARGLLGRTSAIQFRHARGRALKEADVVVVAGFPFDFRLKYGRGLAPGATVIAANLSASELRQNRTPQLGVQMHPADLLRALAERMPASEEPRWQGWLAACRQRESARDGEISASARRQGELVDPIHLFTRLEEKLDDDAVLVMDGGDVVATASYILRPRSPLSWLDPGVFGTLGVGGGFAVGACAVRPDAQVWIIYGDGSSAYSLAEFDTFVRHGMAPIAVVGNDASWHQIARDQASLLGSDVGTTLRRTDYHLVAEGYGGVGLLLDDATKVDEALDEAKAIARSGRPVCVNVHLAPTDFREGSISI
jgi:acetolactate synthase-1/2/3 large subunit